MTYSRKRENYPGQRIEFTQGPSLGDGASAVVCLVTEKKAGGDDFLTPRKVDGFARVVKRFTLNMTAADVEYVAMNEFQLTKLASHLHVKPPIKLANNDYLIVMDKMPGESLRSICETTKSGALQLSASQYLSLVIDIVKKYQSQVEACGLVHRDIKPENIMVDLSNPDYPNANFIDYGLAKKVSDVKRSYVGSRLYMAPEIAVGEYDHSLSANCTVTSDIFSLGISFLRLLCNNFNQNYVNSSKFRISEIIYSEQNKNGTLYFSNVLYPFSDELKKVIEGMCHVNPEKRTNLVYIEKKLHEIRIKIDSSGCTDDEKRMIKNAHKMGWLARSELNKSRDLKRINELINNLELDDAPVAINEFIKTLGIRSLIGCTSKESLLKKVEEIAGVYENNYAKLEELLCKLEAFEANFWPLPSYRANGFVDKVNQCVNLVNRKLKKYNQFNCASLDEIVHAADRLGDAVRIVDQAFGSMLSSLSADNGYDEKLSLMNQDASVLKEDRFKSRQRSIKEEIARAEEETKRKEEGNLRAEGQRKQAELEERDKQIKALLREMRSYKAKMDVISDQRKRYEKFENEYKNNRFYRNERIAVAIKESIRVLQSKIDDLNDRKFLSFEEHVELNERLDGAIGAMPNVLGVMIENRLKRVLTRMQDYHLQSGCSDLIDLMNDFANNQPGGTDELLQLKEVIRLAMSGYVYETATAKNMFFHERAASARRIADMRDVINVIGQENKTVDEIKQELEDKITHINTGFFGRSKLRDVIRHAIEVHGGLKADAGGRLEV